MSVTACEKVRIVLWRQKALDLSKNYGAVTNFLDLRHTKLPIYDPDEVPRTFRKRDISLNGPMHLYLRPPIIMVRCQALP